MNSILPLRGPLKKRGVIPRFGPPRKEFRLKSKAIRMKTLSKAGKAPKEGEVKHSKKSVGMSESIERTQVGQGRL